MKTRTFRRLILAALPIFFALLTTQGIAQSQLIVNGNFTSGNTGFGTDYELSNSLSDQSSTGQYAITSAIGNVAHGWSSIVNDHTTGSGKYMLVNGNCNSNEVETKRVWYETVNVVANTTYDLSLWAINATWDSYQNMFYAEQAPAILKVKINGTDVCSRKLQYTEEHAWEHLTATWYSGSATTATIAIYDLNSRDNANDFALDDISFLKHYNNINIDAIDDNLSTCVNDTLAWQHLATENDIYYPSEMAQRSVKIVSQPSHGHVSWSPSLYNYVYVPTSGYIGTDSFKYRFGSEAYNIWDTATIHVTVTPLPERDIYVTACDEYTWDANGQTYTASGVYDYYKVSSTLNKCDSTLHLILTIKETQEYVLPNVEVCDKYTWNGTTYTQSGYYEYVDNSGDCPINYYLPLTVNKSDTTYYNIETCDSYTWFGNTYTTGGQFTQVSTNASGCMHLDILNLTIDDDHYEVQTIEACDSYTWPINGQTYYASENTSVTIPDPTSSCDKTYVLDLTINNSKTHTDDITICDGSIVWINGSRYTESVSGVTHTMQTATGCDSVVTLNLTVNHKTYVNHTIEACDSYTWVNGVTYYTSTPITTKPVSYVFDEPNSQGCDSVARLFLTINKSEKSQIFVTECDSYTWHDTTYTQSGVYTYLTQTVNGCDSTVLLDLTINNSNEGADVQTACDSYTWIDGNTYTESNNTATYTLTNAIGCDSIVTLDLTINNSNTGIDVQTACESFTWIDGNTYTESNNTATYTLTNATGCDSIVTLNLTINNSNTGIDVQTACDNYTWIDGNTYTENNNTATYTLTNAAGCDSIVTLDLTINSSSTGIDVQTACDNYTWIDGNNYTESNNTATYTLTNAIGCDSIVTLDLTINNSSTSIDVQTACDSYTWIDGNTYTESNNTATYTLTNAIGCDSIVTLDLTINNSNTGIDVQTACDNYTWIDGNTYTESNNTATYTLTNATGCDSIVTLDLTINSSNTGIDVQTACDNYTWIDGNTYTESNNTATYTLTNAAGCDSIVTLDLTINSSITGIDVQTACDSYTWIDGNTYTESNNTTTFTLTNAAGCDSIVTLDLTIKPSTTYEFIATACDIYAWDGIEYTQSGEYVRGYEATNGCDSTVTMTLTINSTYNDELDVTSCGAYTWNDNVYEESGEYTQQFITPEGCDSIITIHLDIKTAPEIEIEGEHNPLGGTETHSSDNIYTLLFDNSTTYDSIQWSVDCDNWQIFNTGDGSAIALRIFTHTTDTVYLTATMYSDCGVTTTTFWIRTTYYGTNEDSESSIVITPNPNNGFMSIILNGITNETDVKVFDSNGNIIDNFVIDGLTNNYKYDIRNKAAGVYYFRMTNNNSTIIKKVVVAH